MFKERNFIMGGLAPIVTSAVGLGAPVAGATLTPLIAKGVMGYMSARESSVNLKSAQNQALNELQQRQNLQMQQAAAQAGLERERIAVEAQANEDSRRSALRRAVARQRAQFGASGIGNAGGGSSEAVLLGLFDETEGELDNRAALDNLRSRTLDMSLSNQGSLNVLQRTQLQERQRLERNVKNFF
jgi:hypothetical protein